MKENPLAASIARIIAAAPAVGWLAGGEAAGQPVRCITFRDYMQQCLYHPAYGYYRKGGVRIGKEGDFYTSSGIGRVLAEVLARYLIRFGRGAEAGPLPLIEWGAGTGRLSAQIAAAGSLLDKDWGSRYRSVIVEDHPAHTHAAKESFRVLRSDGYQRIDEPVVASSEEAWGADWLREPAVILANELLDAFPVHRVQILQDELVELGVTGDAAEGFREACMPVSDPRIGGWLARDGIRLREGQRTEVHADAASFLNRLGGAMTEGRLILIDYGHEADEYAAEHRMLGTLMCYWRHQASDSPYERIGEQDMTSHVPFTFVRKEAERSGWRLAGYSSQKQFLTDNGVLDLLAEHSGADPFGEAARMNRAVRQLLLSDRMSESFKVMVLDKANGTR
ncbi:class I SAM-dependent methyltransferase [Paenibacillus arenilitoris]|uniref:SAM-dependent methyltransferase n=1 Tax=Paenibacillus arenilitoris TaxID=2772299 RepID=A0A927CP14_9BACL|nr:SAM-dependent methyltransferase [Paenibacillus arenilitoris]MBD2870143.1 SAM-dependent methyltransferase [Paenibacillus arenilitoris]